MTKREDYAEEHRSEQKFQDLLWQYHCAKDLDQTEFLYDQMTMQWDKYVNLDQPDFNMSRKILVVNEYKRMYFKELFDDWVGTLLSLNY